MSKTKSDIPEHFHNDEHAPFILGRVKESREERDFCDVVLISGIDGTRVPAHRLILSASSVYFTAMFQGSMLESKQDEVILRDVPGHILDMLVQYCYSGCLELKEEIVEELLPVICLLQLDDVIPAVSEFVVRHLQPANCVGFSIFGDHYNLNKLNTAANDFIYQYFMEVWKNDEFLNLSVEHLSPILSSDNLVVSSEDDVMHSLIAWKQHDPTTRDKDIRKLLSLVRFPLLTPSFVSENVVPIFDGIECQQLISKNITSNQAAAKPRNAHRHLLSIGSMDDDEEIIIEIYCDRRNQWSKIERNMPERGEFNAAEMDGKLYILGGEENYNISNSVLRLDLNVMEWTEIRSLNESRVRPGVAVLNGFIYAVGGYANTNTNEALKSVERYDPATDIWKMMPEMATPRAGAGVAVLNGCLYIVGGRSNIVSYHSVECYDPVTNEWTYKASLTENRSEFGIASINGYLYVFGGVKGWGEENVMTVERYDPAENTWTVVTSHDRIPHMLSCTVHGNRIIISSADNEKGALVEEYDLQTNTFKELASPFFELNSPVFLSVPTIQLPPNFHLFSENKTVFI